MGQDRIAVTVWGERVSPVLDVSSRALLLTLQDGQAGERTELELPEAGDAKLAALSNRGVRTLLCGAVSRSVAEQAAAFGLRLVPFLAGEVEQVIAAYLAGQLPQPSLSMPGCHGRQHGRRSRRCRRGQAV
jgi:predicted Fe-Mo cluster-binding NifX family protein